MSATITVELPEELLLEALRKLPLERRRALVSKLEGELRIQARSVPAAALDKLTGLISMGGDALEDSERLYDDAGGA